jgi:hypothetical protein
MGLAIGMKKESQFPACVNLLRIKLLAYMNMNKAQDLHPNTSSNNALKPFPPNT